MRRATLSCFLAFLGVTTSLTHAQSTQAAQAKAGPSQLTYSEFWQRSHDRPSLRHAVSSSHPAAGMADPATPPNFAGFFAAQTLPGIAPVSANSDAIAFLTADFNNDGHPDLATVDSRSGVAVSLNDGAGHFGTPIMTSPTSATLATSALAAMTIDLNGDGFPDLILVTTTSQISVLINQKNGTFAQSAIVDLANAPPVSAITNFLPFVNIAFTAGVTGNSTSPDIIVEYVVPPSNAQMGAVLYRTVFLNDGAAGFSDAAQKTVSTSVNSSYSLHGFEENFVPGRLILADANHDGKPDLFTAASSNGYLIDVALGNGDGTFAPPASNSVVSLPNASTSFLYAPVFTVASLTSNASNQDLILGGDNSIYYAAANGDGTYQAPVLAVQRGKLGSLGTIDFIQIADVNSDGRPDLLVGGSGNVTAYPGNGDGTFGLASSSTVNTNSYLGFPGLVIADFTGDGKLDFADASEYSSDVALGIGNGDGTFAATPVLYSSTLSLSPLLFDVDAAFDLDNDGKTDLIGSNLSDGTIIAALTGPGGKFNYKVALPASPTVYYAPESVFADFNGDGNIDLIFGEGHSGFPTSYGVAVSLSNGDGTFQPPVPIKLPATLLNAVLFNSFAVGDINGDGKPDLVFTYPGDEQQYPAGSTPPGYFVALGKGDGSFAQAVFTPFGATPSYVLLAHYHGNSSPLDLVIADPDMPTSGVPVSQVSLLRGEGDGTFGPPTVILSGFYPYNILSDDFNKDGKPDLTVSAPFDDNFDTTKSALFQLAGHGDGTFASPVSLSPGGNPGIAIYADVNGDGDPDLVYAGSDNAGRFAIDSGLTVLLGNSDGTYAPPITYPLTLGAQPYAGNFLADNTQSIVASFFTGAAFFMNLGGTSLTPTLTPSTLVAAQPVTLSVAVAPTLTSRPAPSGTITFLDGTTVLGTSNLSAGSATITTNQLAAGAHTFNFQYSGDGNFQPNTATTSASVAPPLPPADFTFSSASTSLSVTPGQPGTLQLSTSANAAFSGSIAFACSGLPSETTCTFSPPNLSLTPSQAGTATLTITTTKASSAAIRPQATRAATLFAFLLLLPLLGASRRRLNRLILLFGVFALTASAIIGCSSSAPAPSSSTDPGTPAGSYAVTVSSTSTSGGTTIAHTIPLTLTVQ